MRTVIYTFTVLILLSTVAFAEVNTDNKTMDNITKDNNKTVDNIAKDNNKTVDNITKDNNTTASTVTNTDNNSMVGQQVTQDNSTSAVSRDLTLIDEDKPYDKYVSINASYYMPNGEKALFNSNFSLGFNFGYLFFEYLGIEVGVSSQTKSGISKYDIKAYITGHYKLTEISKMPLSVYGGAGVVYSSLDLAADSNGISGSKSSFSFGAKAGLKLTVAKRYNFGVVAEYLGARFYNKDFSSTLIGAEVSVMF